MSDNQYYEYNPYTVNQNEPKKPKKPRKERPVLKKLAKVIAIALVFGLVSGLTFQGVNIAASKLNGSDSDKSSSSTTTTTLGTSGDIGTTATSTATTITDVSDIVTNAMPAIVQVTAVSVTEYRSLFGSGQSYESESAGSGIIISQDDDYIYIATNNHVVSGASQLTITFADDSAVAAEIQGTDTSTDLAVVKVAMSDVDSSTLSAIAVATLGDSDSLSVGESAVVIGNALGYGQSVTTGVISALNREVQLEAEDGTAITNELIQTDAAVNPGNSGGALLNMKGEVVGIVSAKYSDTDVEGMGYAIPITSAKTIIEQLMNGQSVSDNSSSSSSNAYLGIAGVDVTSSLSSSYNLPAGVYVYGVYSNTGAADAGLTRGDVITAIDGNKVSGMTDIQSYLATKSAGDTVTLTVCSASSNYKDTEDVQVTLTAKQELQQ
ncbi:MAG: trypsin-like peptidase domain-containing protein [Lachnospiraceae bacterium]|nr:trypsin-like peptidase domain-containing protein [Lachnospiraceae bacterium]